VVNPTYRHLGGQVRSLSGELSRRLANFAAITLKEPIESKHVEPLVRCKAALQEEIETLQQELATRKAERKATPQHIPIDELPEEARFRQLSTQSKHLLDTIKMIAYRAETAMAYSLREHLSRPHHARRLLCALYTTDADLLPDPSKSGHLNIGGVTLHQIGYAAGPCAPRWCRLIPLRPQLRVADRHVSQVLPDKQARTDRITDGRSPPHLGVGDAPASPPQPSGTIRA
jgi:hypothetical protein